MNIPNFRRAGLLLMAVFVLLPFSAAAKDQWLQVRSKNFNLIGNAADKDIRKVATKLEQFRETFRLLFTNMRSNSPIPTNVVVFKNDGAYKPFKPKRGDGKIDNFVAGYFQPGDDVNYITLSAAGEDADMYGIIFHEYVHFLLDTNFGKSDVPTWFNEGLAEYYQTFQIEEDQKVKLGLPQSDHLYLLSNTKLIPLETLFKIDNYSLRQNGNHSKSIFYAQSWALVHYLIQGGKNEALGKFLASLMKNVSAEKAFKEAFQMTYADMEKELRKYIGKSSFQYQMITLKDKLVFDAGMQVAPLGEAESNAYLGDLLYHINRYDDAEPYLMTALSVNPDLNIANVTLGMVKVRQRKWADARNYLEKAILRDQRNHLAYYWYAYLLSREDRDEFGFVRSFPAERAAKMREMLKKAISVDPSFSESYELLAFVSLVNNEELDDAVAQLKKALQYQPGNQRYLLRIAEIYARQDKFDEASAIVEKIASTADDQSTKSRADNLVAEIRQRKDINARNEAARKQFEEAMAAARTSGSRPMLVRGRQPSPEEIKKVEEENAMRAVNRALREPLAGETRVLGSIQKVECKGKTVTYSVKTDEDAFLLASKDFQSLILTAFIPEDEFGEVGCDAKLDSFRTVLTFKPAADPRAKVRGELIALEIVPGSFRFVDTNGPDPVVFAASPDAPPPPTTTSVTGVLGNPSTPPDLEAQRRTMMMNALKEALRKPLADEHRALGFIERAECTAKGMFFHVKSGSQLLRLAAPSGPALHLRGFTPEIESLRVDCSLKAVDVPVVFTYKPAADAKSRTAGDLVALEFVPKTFVLE